MLFAIYTLLSLGCSIVVGGVSFLVGRCGRRLPVDGQLPQVVGSARFARGYQEPGVPAHPGRTTPAS